MSIFDNEASAIIDKAFTKDNIIQSIEYCYKNECPPHFHYQEGCLKPQSNSYATLSWWLDDLSNLGRSENTAGYQLEYITAYFDCNIDSTGDVVLVEITGFKEIEVEHEESVSGLDGEYYIRNSKYLSVEPKDLKDVFERAVAANNKETIETNKLNPLSSPLKTIELSIS